MQSYYIHNLNYLFLGNSKYLSYPSDVTTSLSTTFITHDILSSLLGFLIPMCQALTKR